MKTLLLRNATLLTLLLAAAAAFAQGPGRHAAGRGGPAVSPTGLAYGAGYQARRMQQVGREGQREGQATNQSDGACPPATRPARGPEPARAKEPGQTPAPARRDTCAATKP
jgi:hypothetical protein